MVCQPGVMAQIIREGMDDYWRVVYSKTDEGLSPVELSWKREWELDMEQMDKKFGKEWDSYFARP